LVTARLPPYIRIVVPALRRWPIDAGQAAVVAAAADRTDTPRSTTGASVLMPPAGDLPFRAPTASGRMSLPPVTSKSRIAIVAAVDRSSSRTAPPRRRRIGPTNPVDSARSSEMGMRRSNWQRLETSNYLTPHAGGDREFRSTWPPRIRAAAVVGNSRAGHSHQ
jgi:hypothetical protein